MPSSVGVYRLQSSLTGLYQSPFLEYYVQLVGMVRLILITVFAVILHCGLAIRVIDSKVS